MLIICEEDEHICIDKMYLCVQCVCVLHYIQLRMYLWFREKPHIVTLIYGSVIYGFKYACNGMSEFCF